VAATDAWKLPAGHAVHVVAPAPE
jgi:hypothetical protein